MLQNFITCLMSLTYNNNRSGPRTDPCVSPQSTATRTEAYPFMDTY